MNSCGTTSAANSPAVHALPNTSASGGCAANAHAYSGSILCPNPVECALLRKRTECALALAAIERMEE